MQPFGTPLTRARLARGPAQIVVIPDESLIDVQAEPCDRLAPVVRFVQLDVPARDFPYHFRLIATIALAEVARPIGRPRPGGGVRMGPEPSVYHRAIRTLVDRTGEMIDLEELACY